MGVLGLIFHIILLFVEILFRAILIPKQEFRDQNNTGKLRFFVRLYD